MMRLLNTEDNFCACVCVAVLAQVKYGKFDFDGANRTFYISVTGINNQMPNYSANKEYYTPCALQ